MAQASLDQIVQRMIDAGESEADIAAVIQQHRTTPAPSESSSASPWLAGGAAVAAGLVAAGVKNPALAQKVGRGILNLRSTSMLSGLAPLKSLLGNIGGAAYGSIERGSLDPLKQVLSSATVREFGSNLKRGATLGTGPTQRQLPGWSVPGRVMGAADEATQHGLQRAGYTPKDSARETLQTPLPRSITDAFDSPIMEFLVPFIKTPFNATVEGARSLNPHNVNGMGTLGGRYAALGTSVGTGAVSGSQLEDPKSIALTTAASGRYGVPHALAAGLTRTIKTGSRSKGLDVADAVSDFGSSGRGVIGAYKDPKQILGLGEPAAMPAWKYFWGIK